MPNSTHFPIRFALFGHFSRKTIADVSEVVEDTKIEVEVLTKSVKVLDRKVSKMGARMSSFDEKLACFEAKILMCREEQQGYVTEFDQKQAAQGTVIDEFLIEVSSRPPTPSFGLATTPVPVLATPQAPALTTTTTTTPQWRSPPATAGTSSELAKFAQQPAAVTAPVPVPVLATPQAPGPTTTTTTMTPQALPSQARPPPVHRFSRPRPTSLGTSSGFVKASKVTPCQPPAHPSTLSSFATSASASPVASLGDSISAPPVISALARARINHQKDQAKRKREEKKRKLDQAAAELAAEGNGMTLEQRKDELETRKSGSKPGWHG